MCEVLVANKMYCDNQEDPLDNIETSNDEWKPSSESEESSSEFEG